MLSAQQVADAKAAAVAAGFDNPGPATIAFYAFAPGVDAAAVVAALQAIAPAVDAATVTSDVAALDTEAKANTTSAQVVSTLQQIGGVLVPIVKTAVGV